MRTMEGEFQLEVIDEEITLFVLWPGILKMTPQGAYELAHVLIEEANKLKRKGSEVSFRTSDHDEQHSTDT